MKNLLKIALAAVAVCAGATACRTNEANYRAAYEKTIAGRDAGVPLDSSVYGKVRRQMTVTMLSAGGDSAELRAIPVNPTPAPDGTPGAIPQPYGIVAGQFKTLFNARSLCDRLHETGYTEASIVHRGLMAARRCHSHRRHAPPAGRGPGGNARACAVHPQDIRPPSVKLRQAISLLLALAPLFLSAQVQDAVSGRWRLTSGGAEIEIAQTPAKAGSYVIRYVDGPDMSIPPGKEIGEMHSTPTPGRFLAHMRSNPARAHSKRRSLIVTLKSEGSLSFQPYRSGMSISLWRLLPYLFRVTVVQPGQQPAETEGAVRADRPDLTRHRVL